MPEYNLTNSIITQLNAQEPWPDNVKLFQPYEVEQILLPDNASCLAVQAFLKMCNLPFEVEMRWNAEFMSPSGRVPFIKCGAFVVSELEPIAQFAANKGVSLCASLSTEEKAEMRAYMSLITNVLVNAEMYISWVDNDTFNAVTKIRNSSVYPWPLGWLQTRSKRNTVIKRLKALHWHDKTLDQVLADVEQCCNSLSQRLGDKDYFFGNTPTPVDALLFGHMRALLSATGPKAALMIKPITSALLRHTLRMINITKMQMTPQEAYLLTQAFQLSRQRMSVSPVRTVSERSTRVKRSRICIKNTSRESVAYNRDVFGFKPFASKQIVIMSTKGGEIYLDTTIKTEMEFEQTQFIFEILEDLLDKVEEHIIDSFTETIDSDQLDFEVIAYPNYTESIQGSVDVKNNEYLDTIEENDVTDTSASGLTTMDMNVGNDFNSEEVKDARVVHLNSDKVKEGYEEDLDSDGLVNQKHLVETVQSVHLLSTEEAIELSDIQELNECYVNECSSGDNISSKNLPKSDDSSSKGSSSTLTMPSKEEISVESLLKYLRKRNAVYNYGEVADID